MALHMAYDYLKFWATCRRQFLCKDDRASTLSKLHFLPLNSCLDICLHRYIRKSSDNFYLNSTNWAVKGKALWPACFARTCSHPDCLCLASSHVALRQR